MRKHRKNRHHVQVRGLEQLETRCLLACSVFQEQATLFIVGDNLDQHVGISDNGQGSVRVSCNQIVFDPIPIEPILEQPQLGSAKLSKLTIAPPVPRADRFDGVERIVLEVGNGNDSVSYRLRPAQNDVGVAVLPRPADLEFDLGPGRDSASISGPTSTLGNPIDDWSIEVDGRSGNDKIQVNLGSVVPHGALSVAANLGSGNDIFVKSFSGWIPEGSNVAVSADGSLGADTLNFYYGSGLAARDASTLPDRTWKGNLQVDLNGGPGKDTQLTKISAATIAGDLSVSNVGSTGPDTLATVFQKVRFEGSHRAHLEGNGGNDHSTLKYVDAKFGPGAGFDMQNSGGDDNDIVVSVYYDVDVQGGPIPLAEPAPEILPVRTWKSLGGDGNDTMVTLHDRFVLSAPVSASTEAGTGDDLIISTFTNSTISADHDVKVLAGGGNDLVLNFEKNLREFAFADNNLSIETDGGSDGVVLLGDALIPLDRIADLVPDNDVAKTTAKRVFSVLASEGLKLERPAGAAALAQVAPIVAGGNKNISIDTGAQRDTVIGLVRGSSLVERISLGIDSGEHHDVVYFDADVVRNFDLKLDTGSGNDRVTIEATGLDGPIILADRLAPAELAVAVSDGGEQSDLFAPTARLNAAVELGGGRDRFKLNATQWGILTSHIRGGEGDDSIETNTRIISASTIRIAGDEGNDVLIGGSGEDLLEGGPGNDTLDGRGGNDVQMGQAGNDILLASAGNDQIDGGEGRDTVKASGGSFKLSDDLLVGPNGEDELSSVEVAVLEGSDEDDEINAENFSGPTTILGRGGNDLLIGGTNDDVIDGGRGNDIRMGMQGNDTLLPSPGNDLLDGGEGNDLLSDGNGDDTFVGGPGNDNILVGRAGVPASVGQKVRIDAGPDNDIVEVDLGLIVDVDLSVDLGSGDDSLTAKGTLRVPTPIIELPEPIVAIASNGVPKKILELQERILPIPRPTQLNVQISPGAGNDDVSIAFDTGAARAPIVLGTLWNGQDPVPPAADPEPAQLTDNTEDLFVAESQFTLEVELSRTVDIGMHLLGKFGSDSVKSEIGVAADYSGSVRSVVNGRIGNDELSQKVRVGEEIDPFLARIDGGAGFDLCDGTDNVEIINCETRRPSTPDLKPESDTGFSDSDNLTHDITPSFAGKATPGSKIILISDRAERIGEGIADDSGGWMITSDELEEGRHAISAFAQDPDGNTAESAHPLVIGVDVTAPEVAEVIPPVNPPPNHRTAIGVVFTERLDPNTAADPANYQLVGEEQGPIDVVPVFGDEFPSKLRLCLTDTCDTPFADDAYELTVIGETSIQDIAGNHLGGGENFVTRFELIAGASELRVIDEGIRARGNRLFINRVVIPFTAPVVAEQANNAENYEIRTAGRDRIFGNDDDRIIPVRVRYSENGQPHSTLRMRRGFLNNQTVQVTVQAIAGSNGDLLDGNGDGIGGDAAERLLTRGNSIGGSDEDGDRFRFRLTRGNLTLVQAVDHHLLNLHLSNTVGRRSQLLARARPAESGESDSTITLKSMTVQDGRSFINGKPNGRGGMRNPPFQVGPLRVERIKKLIEASLGTLPEELFLT